MRFIKSNIGIDFIGKRKTAFLISVAMVLVSIISLIVHRGPRYGVDFAGGTLIQIKFLSPTNIDDIKSGLFSIGMGQASVQTFGDKKRE